MGVGESKPQAVPQARREMLSGKRLNENSKV